jgi:hypothetical protein
VIPPPSCPKDGPISSKLNFLDPQKALVRHLLELNDITMLGMSNTAVYVRQEGSSYKKRLQLEYYENNYTDINDYWYIWSHRVRRCGYAV